MTEDVQATPAAQAAAEEAGVDLTQVEGTGSEGTITKADVVAAASAPEPTGPITHVTDDPNFTVGVHVFAGSDGRWVVALDPQVEGGASHELTVSVGGRSVWQGLA